jgi:murein DD-endopeptidase MepM/ murein hydrolase activator NlpD
VTGAGPPRPTTRIPGQPAALPALAFSLCSLAGLAAGCAHKPDTISFAEAGLTDDADESTEAPSPPAAASEEAPAEPSPSAQSSADPRATALAPLAVQTPPPLSLRWPVKQAGVSSLFGLRRDPIDHAWRMHWGLDLAAPRGRVVGAAAAGFVVHAGWSRGYGLMVEVRHRAGLTTRYSHLALVTCSPGEAVETGQPLGLVGSTGRATGPHLHFEVWRQGRPRDPLAMFAPASFRSGE